jgi:hypothetical protein
VVTLSKKSPAQFAASQSISQSICLPMNGKAVHADCYVGWLKTSF